MIECFRAMLNTMTILDGNIDLNNNPVDDIVEKYDGDISGIPAEVGTHSYYSSYYIPWKAVERFIDEVKKIKGVMEVEVIPNVVIGTVDIRSTDQAVVVSDLWNTLIIPQRH